MTFFFLFFVFFLFSLILFSLPCFLLSCIFLLFLLSLYFSCLSLPFSFFSSFFLALLPLVFSFLAFLVFLFVYRNSILRVCFQFRLQLVISLDFSRSFPLLQLVLALAAITPFAVCHCSC